MGHCGGGFIDEHEDSFAPVFDANSKVVKFSGPAEGDFSFVIESIGANSVVCGDGFSYWCCFDGIVRFCLGFVGDLVSRSFDECSGLPEGFQSHCDRR